MRLVSSKKKLSVVAKFATLLIPSTILFLNFLFVLHFHKPIHIQQRAGGKKFEIELPVENIILMKVL